MLTNDYLKLVSDEKGREYHEPGYQDIDSNRGAMPGDSECPVMHIKKYKKHLNPQCTALFQRPNLSIYRMASGIRIFLLARTSSRA